MWTNFYHIYLSSLSRSLTLHKRRLHRITGWKLCSRECPCVDRSRMSDFCMSCVPCITARRDYGRAAPLLACLTPPSFPSHRGDDSPLTSFTQLKISLKPPDCWKVTYLLHKVITLVRYTRRADSRRRYWPSVRRLGAFTLTRRQ